VTATYDVFKFVFEIHLTFSGGSAGRTAAASAADGEQALRKLAAWCR
jgi:hypothetical protein